MTIQKWINWHKFIGMIASLFIIVLALSGLILIHAEDLELRGYYVESDWLLNWYGIQPEGPPVAYAIDGHWLTQIDSRIYFDEFPLTEISEAFRGVVNTGGIYALAFENSLILLTEEGEIIERLSELHGLPQALESIAVDNRQIIIKTGQGLYTSDLDFVTWSSGSNENIMWSTSSTLPDTLEDVLLRAHRGEGLPLERLVLDLHSGRILGKFGIWIVDIAVLSFLVMSLTGWLVLFKRRAIQKNIDDEL